MTRITQQNLESYLWGAAVLTVEDAMKRLRGSAKAAFAVEERLIGILKLEGLLV